jgi:hypothetical protein
MTNNPTIDGVSRELLANFIEYSSPISSTDQQWHKDKQALRALLDAPVVERQPVAWMYLERSEDGYEYRPLFSPTKWLVLPDGFYEESPLYAAPPEVAALQSTIAQLQARIAELESGRVEPVARDQQVTELSEFMGRLSGGLRHFAGQIIDAGWIKHPPSQNSPIGFRDPEFSWATISAENKEMMASLGHDVSCFSLPLFTAPPAPVAVVLPERQEVESGEAYMQEDWVSGWNACLDAIAALNGVRK